MQFCYKAALYASFGELAIALSDENIFNLKTGFTLNDSNDEQQLYHFVESFLVSDYFVHHVTLANIFAEVYATSKQLARLWRQLSWVLVSVSLLLSMKMEEFTRIHAWSKFGPTSIFALAIVGSVVLRFISAAADNDAVDGHPTFMNQCTATADNNSTRIIDADDARKMGLLTSRNHVFSAGGYILYALVRFATIVANDELKFTKKAVAYIRVFLYH